MIPIWLANPGEDFRIDKVKKPITLVTVKGKDMDLKELEGCVLPITAKAGSSICGVFHGHRIMFDKLYAKSIFGTVLGKTQGPVEVLSAEPCSCNCASCGGCFH